MDKSAGFGKLATINKVNILLSFERTCLVDYVFLNFAVQRFAPEYREYIGNIIGKLY